MQNQCYLKCHFYRGPLRPTRGFLMVLKRFIVLILVLLHEEVTCDPLAYLKIATSNDFLLNINISFKNYTEKRNLITALFRPNPSFSRLPRELFI